MMPPAGWQPSMRWYCCRVARLHVAWPSDRVEAEDRLLRYGGSHLLPRVFMNWLRA